MSTDYDAPRRPAGSEEQTEAPADIAKLTTARQTQTPDAADAVVVEAGSPAWLDTVGDDEDLTAPIVPAQLDEFMCTRCFMLLHHNRRAPGNRRAAICVDCA